MKERTADSIGAICLFLVVVVFGFLCYNALRVGEENKEQADKNCGPYKQVAWFHDDDSKVRSVCRDAENNYVVKP